MEIREDDVTSDEILALLREHLDEMHSITPPESVHALDVSGLRAPDVTFWTVWMGAKLAGCGALKELGPDAGEIKSMRTADTFRGRGIGAAVLEWILAVAAERGYARLFLETGSMAEFAPARRLYERYGFDYCPPFGDYGEDPNSVFMTRAL